MAPRLDAYALTPTGSTGRMLALRSLVGLSGAQPEARTTWIDVGYTGSWQGHADGPFEITPADLASCVAASEAQVNPISSDYEHASLTTDGKPKPAPMWIQKLKVERGHLYALAEFTPEAAELVKGGGYRFCSGVFAFGWPDRATGKQWPCVLRSVALTNDPFLDGQRPIALTARRSRALGGKKMTATKITKADILAGLKQIEGEDLNAAQLEALLASIAAMAAAKDPTTGEEPEAVEPPASEEPAGESEAPAEVDMALGAFPSNVAPTPDQVVVVDPNAATPPPAPETPASDANATGQAMTGAKLSEATGLGGAELLAAVETNLDAVVSAIRGAGAQIANLTATGAAGSIAALSARLRVFEDREAALVARAKADAAAAALAATETEIAGLVASGSILPAMVDTFRSLAREAPAQYRALTASMPKGTAFPAGRNASLARPDAAPIDIGSVDETRPEVRALRALYAGKPKADADAAVLKTFGPTTRVG